MSVSPSERSASRGKARVSAVPNKTRGATPQGAPGKRAAGREKLADILRFAEERAQFVASFRLEFETLEPAREFKRELEQLRHSDRQFSKYLLVHKTGGRSFEVVYNPHSTSSVLPGRELAQHSLSELVRRGALVRAAEFAEKLGLTKQAISKALRDKRVFTLEVEGAQYYPSFYTDSQLDRRQVERVTKELGDLPGTSKLQFFLTPKHSLGGVTPLKALAQGKLELVKASARGFAQR